MSDVCSQASTKSERPDVALSIDPETGFYNAGGGKSEHMLVNTGEKRLAVKIRCSNNELYRVNPPMMFIESGQCENLIVTRLPGPSRTDKLVVQFVACQGTDVDIKKIYAVPGIKTESLRVALKMNGERDPADRRRQSYERCDDAGS